MRRALASPALWAWLALSALPPELAARALGWDWVEPGALALGLLWWPLDTLGRLGALRVLLVELDAPAPGGWRSATLALPSALAAEILLALRCTCLALLGLVPSLALLSLLEPAQLARWSWRGGLLGLALLGLLPAGLYALRRLLAPLELLRAPLKAGEALDASEKRLRGRLKTFLRLSLPWVALSWALSLAGPALNLMVAGLSSAGGPGPAGGAPAWLQALPDWVDLGLMLPSAAAGVVAIAVAGGL